MISLKILAVGDIVGSAGIRELKLRLKEIKENENIDFIIVNGENAAEGMGITEKNFNDIISQGVDVVTMGNHTWGKKDIFKFIDDPKIIRPANYPEGVVGKGYNIYTCKGKKIAVINIMGRVDINILTENPFLIAKKIIEKPSLLICGYSFGDLYVNQIIQRHKLVHDKNERVMIVDKWDDVHDTDSLFKQIKEKANPGLREYVLRIIECAFEELLDTFKQFNQVADGCWESPNGVLRIYTKGFKSAVDGHQSNILSFLQ